MSTGDERDVTMDAHGRRRTAAAAFIVLLVLALFWPAPVVSVNELCCHAALAIDELSFLGRESPRWDVVFWCVAGLFLLSVAQSGRWEWRDLAEPWRELGSYRAGGPAVPLLTFASGAVLTALTWRFFDAPVTRWAERVQSTRVEDVIRITNRLGGGMNPALVVIFFFFAGIVYRHRPWIRYGRSMALAGAAAGISVQVLKFLAGRTRPELWLGPFQHARTAATSFPSGHTIGAFAIAGVLIFQSPSRTMRVAALLLAASVGVSRVLTFRHWTSDVLASTIIGLLLAWMVSRAVPAGASEEAFTAPVPRS